MEGGTPRILIDANVAYTYLSGRDDPYASEDIKIMELCSRGGNYWFSCFSFDFHYLVSCSEMER